MKKKVQVEVAGKLNLSLNVTGRDSYHSLDSVFSSVSQFDTVTVTARADDKVRIDFVDCAIDPYRSTAAKAVEAVRRRFGDFGVDVVVRKGIPAGSGLGGSSADAAGVLVALDCLFDLSARGFHLHSAACETGSDTAFMLRGGMARARGRGERLEYFDGSVPYRLLLAYPTGGVETAVCFRRFDELYPDFIYAPADVDRLVESLKKGDRDCVRQFQNALTKPAVSINPAVGTTLDAMQQAGALASFMSGSGCACVGVFEPGNPLPEEVAGFAATEVFLLKEGIKIS